MRDNIKTTQFRFSFQELSLSENEVLFPMGYKNGETDKYISDLISSEFENLNAITEIEGGYRLVSPEFIKSDYKIRIKNTIFEPGKIVWQFLKKSEQIAIFLCTAGKTISNRSKELMANGNFIEGYVVDTIGSVAVEKAMDIIHKSIKATFGNATNHYSPGYCNWNVSEQQKLFSLMPMNYLGILLNESSLMSPVKSVSGFIGLGADVKYDEYMCVHCTQKNCLYSNKMPPKIRK